MLFAQRVYSHQTGAWCASLRCPASNLLVTLTILSSGGAALATSGLYLLPFRR